MHHIDALKHKKQMIVNQDLNDKKSKSSSIKFRLHIALLSDVDIDQFPYAEGATIGEVKLKAGKTWHYIDCQQNSIKPIASTVGEVSPMGKLSIDASIEGITKETLAYLYEVNGERVIASWENCVSREKFLAGSICSGGLVFKYDKLGNQGDWQGATIKLDGGECPEPFWFYTGTTPTIIPASTKASGNPK